jgi:glucokinase
MAKKQTILALDIGGTSIQAALVAADGSLTLLPTTRVDSSPAVSAAEIIETFAGAIRGAGGAFDGVGICIPGPFDYERGVSLMTHKFAALNGVNLKTALSGAVAELANLPVVFCHDANAFLAGELWRGGAQGYRRAIGVTLGTGIGVSCCIDGEFLITDLGSPAREVSVWDRPYGGGIVEDVVSTRSLVRRYRRLQPGYDASNGVKGIAEAAKAGQPEALEIFRELGDDLGRILAEVVRVQRAEVVVFGGQIAKDFGLFEPAFAARLAKHRVSPVLGASELGGAAALYGAAACAGFATNVDFFTRLEQV